MRIPSARTPSLPSYRHIPFTGAPNVQAPYGASDYTPQYIPTQRYRTLFDAYRFAQDQDALNQCAGETVSAALPAIQKRLGSLARQHRLNAEDVEHAVAGHLNSVVLFALKTAGDNPQRFDQMMNGLLRRRVSWSRLDILMGNTLTARDLQLLRWITEASERLMAGSRSATTLDTLTDALMPRWQAAQMRDRKRRVNAGTHTGERMKAPEDRTALHHRIQRDALKNRIARVMVNAKQRLSTQYPDMPGCREMPAVAWAMQCRDLPNHLPTKLPYWNRFTPAEKQLLMHHSRDGRAVEILIAADEALALGQPVDAAVCRQLVAFEAARPAAARRTFTLAQAKTQLHSTMSHAVAFLSSPAFAPMRARYAKTTEPKGWHWILSLRSLPAERQARLLASFPMDTAWTMITRGRLLGAYPDPIETGRKDFVGTQTTGKPTLFRQALIDMRPWLTKTPETQPDLLPLNKRTAFSLLPVSSRDALLSGFTAKQKDYFREWSRPIGSQTRKTFTPPQKKLYDQNNRAVSPLLTRIPAAALERTLMAAYQPHEENDP